MYLDYETTMKRIDKWDKERFSWESPLNRKKKFPWLIKVYKGENQIVIVPSITTAGWYMTEMAWYKQIFEVDNIFLVGESVLEAITHIENSPVDARTRDERNADNFRQFVSKHKSYSSFNKKYLLCGISISADRSMSFTPEKWVAGNNNENGGMIEDSGAKLPPNASAEEIGKALIDSFRTSEEYHASIKNKLPAAKRETIELLTDDAPYKNISYEVPKDKHFVDAEDYHAMEIHQGYSYCPNDDEESVADFYFSMGAEIDCNPEPENIRLCWEKHYGKADVFKVSTVEHSIFTIRAEMKNKKVHQISYYREFAEGDMLTCEMIVQQPNRRKKTDERLTKMFGEFVDKCRWETE